MKYIQIIVLWLFSLSSQVVAQNKVTVQGEVQGYNNKALVYFIYSDVEQGKEIIDSVRLNDGKLLKDIYVSEPTLLVMVMSPNGKFLNRFTSEERQGAEALGFYVDKGDFKIKFDGSFKKFNINPQNKIVSDFKGYNAIINKDRKLILDSINRHYAFDGRIEADGTIRINADKVEEYDVAILDANNGEQTELLSFAKENSDSYIGLLALLDLYKSAPSLSADLLVILNQYSNENQNTRIGKELRKMLDLAVKVGM